MSDEVQLAQGHPERTLALGWGRALSTEGVEHVVLGQRRQDFRGVRIGTTRPGAGPITVKLHPRLPGQATEQRPSIRTILPPPGPDAPVKHVALGEVKRPGLLKTGLAERLHDLIEQDVAGHIRGRREERPGYSGERSVCVRLPAPIIQEYERHIVALGLQKALNRQVLQRVKSRRTPHSAFVLRDQERLEDFGRAKLQSGQGKGAVAGIELVAKRLTLKQVVPQHGPVARRCAYNELARRRCRTADPGPVVHRRDQHRVGAPNGARERGGDPEEATAIQVAGDGGRVDGRDGRREAIERVAWLTDAQLAQHA